MQKVKSIIVYGPPGVGKTKNAERMKKFFGLSEIIDGYIAPDPYPEDGALLITNDHGGRFPIKNAVLAFSEVVKMLPAEKK